ncbi:hypothetical protein SPRG_05150 [Saprolegnia parasitica CBS 223.65]|uniref:G-patch domain-containing protein n=1 Tax=Saprolegnia parasitica (strain CBS 223.65) TaxID=695850 RepID=A0A067CL68_SAPPC|nr:hypothetical protein SPRG_05150 [Saprolegnia parasitica CBS 223.65]KDO29960.1 hypothetical protein SPRG_05150 [Saprolegnia parasitica CBS 223.65]|eukprot:XP_012199144.1 hypothetical protein SPRG_05150 [Saprolegnia parasitica CBS 223.65]
MSVVTVPIVGKKFLAQLGGMANESAASEVSSFAKKQMAKMGWSQGKGLGKEEQGIATHIKVKRREENTGVGTEAAKTEEQSNQWWYNVYNKMASKIVVDASDDDDDDGKKKSKKAKKAKKRSRAEMDVPTDEQLFAATGGKLFGRRAYGSCKGKLMRDALQTKGVVDDNEEKAAKKAKKAAKKAKKEAKKAKKEAKTSSSSSDSE